jgi:hypothetical protein
MSLKDQIETHQPTVTKRCVVGKMLNTMTDEDMEAFQSIAPRIGHEPGYTYTWARDVLAREGFQVGENVLRRHLKGQCVCR